MTTTQNISEIKSALVAKADAAHVQFPQYRGHWDQWVVAVTTKRITHRGRVIERGTHVLMNPASIHPGGPGSRYPDVVFATIYWDYSVSTQSFRSDSPVQGCDTSVRADALKTIG